MGSTEKWTEVLTLDVGSSEYREVARAVSHVISELGISPNHVTGKRIENIRYILGELVQRLSEIPSTPAPGNETLNLDMELAPEGQPVIAITVHVEFPKGEGMWALCGLDSLDQYTHALIPELVKRGDESTVTALAQFKAEEEREQIANTLKGGQQ